MRRCVPHRIRAADETLEGHRLDDRIRKYVERASRRGLVVNRVGACLYYALSSQLSLPLRRIFTNLLWTDNPELSVHRLLRAKRLTEVTEAQNLNHLKCPEFGGREIL